MTDKHFAFLLLLFCSTTHMVLADNTRGRGPLNYAKNAILTKPIENNLEPETEDNGDEDVLQVDVEVEEIAGEPMLPPVVSDSIYILRLRRLHTVIDLPFNSIVRSYIKLYTDKKRIKSQEILGLSEYYFPLFEQILDQYGMPHEIKYLAVIESALNPVAVSRAKATGLWQFMYATGRMYGLNVTSTIDDRCDPIASTHAAAKHLRDLYNMFGDWALALAAYNCGSGNVNKAIRRSGGRKDFWGIYNYLPRETRGYVPAFIGATYMMNYAKEHHLKPAQYDFRKFFDYDTIRVNQWMHFDQISAVLGISKQELRTLNPQFRRNIVPGNERTHTLKLPSRYIDKYLLNEKEIALFRAEEYNPKAMAAPAEFTAYVPSGKEKINYRVQSGETLGSIASKYGVRVQDLKSWNGLRSNMIRAGQRLHIYIKGNKAQLFATKTPIEKSQTITKNGFLYYKIRKGDSLWAISKQFAYMGVTQKDILTLNNMNIQSALVPGQILKIKKVN
ncbi:MAG: LysM peptidoglycan-binding domain-containing protein [Bacteroidales bacterium]